MTSDISQPILVRMEEVVQSINSTNENVNPQPIGNKRTERAPLLSQRRLFRSLSGRGLNGRSSAGATSDEDSSRTLGSFAGVFAPVSLSQFSTLLFLRIGFIIGSVGLFLACGTLTLAYVILLFTILSICAISTNGAVEGGGAYYMIHLSWNLARNIKVSDQKLFELLKGCLMRSMRHVSILLDFVKQCGLTPKFHGRTKNEASHYCGACEVEVFDVLFVKEQDRRHVVHCIDCARKQSPRLDCFVVLEEYHLSDLCQVYDNFILHPMATSSPSLAPTPPPMTPTGLLTS